MSQTPVITHQPMLQMLGIINRTQRRQLQMPVIPYGILQHQISGIPGIDMMMMLAPQLT
jgi:hypothetical protein